MTPERLQQVSRIYHDALVRDTSEREAFVRQACGDDEAMRQEVESLLIPPASAEDFLGEPAMAMAARLMQPDAATSLLTGRRIGPYQLRTSSASAAWAKGMRARHQART